MPVSIEKVRGVQWETDFDWELKFGIKSGLIKPFDDWFPAVEVDLGLHDLETTSFDISNFRINILKGNAETPIRITFNDDYKGTIEKWLKTWMKNISDFNKGLLPLSESYKQVIVRRLSPQKDKTTGLKKILDEERFLIVPSGTLQDNKSQNSKAKVFSMEFKIVG